MSTPKPIELFGLGYKLKQAQHMLRTHMDVALKPLGLTTPQYAALSQLEQQPGISNAALARVSFVTAQTMHGIVANLEKRRLLVRKGDPKHGRILCARLTKSGLVMATQAHALVSRVETSMTFTMNKTNKVILENLLIECVNNLREIER